MTQNIPGRIREVGLTPISLVPVSTVTTTRPAVVPEDAIAVDHSAQPFYLTLFKTR